MKIYKKVPKGYMIYDPARSLAQAKALAKSYPKDAMAIIVKTGEKGDVFLYHIAVKTGRGY